MVNNINKRILQNKGKSNLLLSLSRHHKEIIEYHYFKVKT